ncbi:MAG: hypothetical protein WAT79_15480 [Saprospiraceae bacterium]
MQDIFLIIQSFDRPKRTSFEKYLLSPYFCPDQENVTLFLQCFKDILLYDNYAEAKTQLPKLSLKQKKQLMQICLDFIAQFEFDSMATMQANLNLRGIRKRNIEKLYKDSLQKIEKLQVTEFDQTADYFYFRSLIEKNIFELKTENEKKNAKVKIASELNMHKISENVDLFYLLEIMKNFVSDYAVFDVSIQSLSSIDEVKFALKAALLYENKYPIVHLYKSFIELVNKKTSHQKTWTEWLSNLEKIAHKIPPQEVDLFVTALEKYAKSLNLTFKISRFKLVNT